MKKIILYAVVPVLSITFVLLLIVNLNAEESQFRKQFLVNYYNDAFQAQSMLIKKYKDSIESEVNALITEAILPEKTFQQRMYLLDIANSIATMHIQWNNGSEELLKKVETLQKEELQKERARTEEIEKLKAAEKVPGNIVMATHKEEMAAKGLSPAIYPHWIHRSFYRCKVCHEEIFIKKRGANGISQAKIQEGKQCGVCHNNTISFSATDEKNCIRCHLAGKPESKPLIDLSYYNSNKFKEIALRVGAEWNPENLPGGKLPLDKVGFINWIELDRIKAFNPLTALSGKPDTDEGVRDTLILFETSTTFLKGVLFSHKIHSTWAKCSLCHPKIFKPELGANRVKMIEIKEGKGCGSCHGSVAFTPSDCLRCHNQTKENLPKDVLINAAGASAPAK